MAFDVNERGAISLTPLAEYEAATVLDTGCALRLACVRPEDPPGTASLVVQVAMTVEQATELARDLQKMVELLLAPQSSEHPN